MLKELLTQNLKATILDLSNKNISNTSELRDLENLKELQELDLQGNTLVDLPDDLSKLQKLKILNVMDNPFNNVYMI